MEETNALRQLPEIQNIAEYLRNMTFRKKLFGGVDAESVLEHFSAVTLQYEAIISAYMQQADVYARRLAEAQALLHSKEEAAARAPQPPQPPQPPQWQGAAAVYPQQQPMRQPMQQQPMPQPQRQPQPQQMQQPMPQQMQQPVQPPQPQPQQPYAPNPWVQQGYNPWAQQPAAPQAYYPPQAPAHAWQDDADGLPEPAFLHEE